MSLLPTPDPKLYACGRNPLGGLFYRNVTGLQVIRTVEEGADFGPIDGEPDTRTWLHVSFSRPNRMPSYEDAVRVHRDFIGEDREAYMVFAPKERHVNHHPYCLHLWCALEGPALPDFRRECGGFVSI